jgi:hypothetical protein
MAKVTQQSLPHEAMWGPKSHHGSVMWKKQKGPRPTSQCTVTENLATAQGEVKEAIPRIIKPKAKP